MKKFVLLMAVVTAAPAFAQDQAPAKPVKVTDKTSPDYVRCRKEPIIGSLVQKTKICRTNAEWKKFSEGEGAEARRLVELN